MAEITLQATTEDIIISSTIMVEAGQTLVFGKNQVVKFENGGKIMGNGRLLGGIISAPLTRQIFGENVIVDFENTFDTATSLGWFVTPGSVDNYKGINNAIQTILRNSNRLRYLFVPKGVYTHSQPIKICDLNDAETAYNQVTIKICGETSYWDSSQGSIFNYTGLDQFALGIQVGKGVEIAHLQFNGKYISPDISNPTKLLSVYKTTPATYDNLSNKTTGDYAAIKIDFDEFKTRSGSTGLHIHDIIIYNFSTGIALSQNYRTQNDEINLFERIQFKNVKMGVLTGQAQEKLNIFRGLYSWGQMHTLFSAGKTGAKQCGFYKIEDVNIAGNCIRLFDIDQGGWFPICITNVYAENIYCIGNLWSTIGLNLTLTQSVIQLRKKSEVGEREIVYAAGLNVEMSYLNLRYYDDLNTNIEVKLRSGASFVKSYIPNPLKYN